MIHGKEGTFWHLISEGKVEEERTPDLRRCERIKWPRAMVERPSAVCIWIAERNGDKRVHIALLDFSYVLVLADRETYLLIWTAFFVEQEHRRRKLKMEYERYALAQKG